MALDLPFKERDINGTLYRVHTLMLNDWAELTEYLAKILGAPLSSVLSGDVAVPEGTDPSLGLGDFQAILGGLVSKLSKRTIVELCAHMGKSLRAGEHILDSKAQRMWWPRHMRDLAPVVGLFLEAQYSDFYEGLSDSLPKVQPDEGVPSQRDSGSSESLPH